MRVLIYFNGFTDVIGGSEYLPLTLAHEFQARGHAVTLALHYASDLAKAQRQYGVELDLAALKVARLDAENRVEWWINRLFRCLRERKLQRLARNFDLCVSTVNPVDFGRPAIHFIYMLGFTRAFRRHLGWQDLPEGGGQTFVHRLWRRVSAAFADRFIVRVRTPDELLHDARECVYPNSNWARQQIESFFGCITRPVFYPPTLFEVTTAGDLPRENTVVSVGRIDPMKRLAFQISVVEAVRNRTGVDLHFVIAGHVNDDDYGRQIRRVVTNRPWVRLAGAVYGAEKARLLSSSKFALHATLYEAFGISVTEYLKYGLVPLVPNVGGASEVVASPLLQYADRKEAVEKLSRMVVDGATYEEALSVCRDRARFFSATEYWRRQRLLVDSWVDSSPSAGRGM